MFTQLLQIGYFYLLERLLLVLVKKKEIMFYEVLHETTFKIISMIDAALVICGLFLEKFAYYSQ